MVCYSSSSDCKSMREMYLARWIKFHRYAGHFRMADVLSNVDEDEIYTYQDTEAEQGKDHLHSQRPGNIRGKNLSSTRDSKRGNRRLGAGNGAEKGLRPKYDLRDRRKYVPYTKIKTSKRFGRGTSITVEDSMQEPISVCDTEWTMAHYLKFDTDYFEPIEPDQLSVTVYNQSGSPILRVAGTNQAVGKFFRTKHIKAFINRQ